MLIVNADDWGRDGETTDRTLDCVLCGSVSSVSAMVFMEDSARAARIAHEHNLDAGLHLNLDLPFSGAVASLLADHQQRIGAFLRGHRLAQVMFHPGLVRSFKFVVEAQYAEFRRLYGTAPRRVDGHHHMHLCSNVLLGRLLPSGAVVRRNFSFQPGEKGPLNRWYRKESDRLLSKRHRLADSFYSIQPLTHEDHLGRILSAAREFTVEMEVHPINEDEFQFLTNGQFLKRAGHGLIAHNYSVAAEPQATNS